MLGSVHRRVVDNQDKIRALAPVTCVMVSLPHTLTSQKVFIKPFCKSQFPHKSVNLSFIITHIKIQLRDLLI